MSLLSIWVIALMPLGCMLLHRSLLPMKKLHLPIMVKSFIPIWVCCARKWFDSLTSPSGDILSDTTWKMVWVENMSRSSVLVGKASHVLQRGRRRGLIEMTNTLRGGMKFSQFKQDKMAVTYHCPSSPTSHPPIMFKSFIPYWVCA